MSRVSIILGLNYGDEAKGATVNSLCRETDETIVVRFNGGHQVGHTVVNNGIRHPFSNFGSGTLKGVSTYWSEYCTVNPVAVLNEGNVLRDKGIKPKVIYDANSMITTPYDIYHNISDKKTINNGSVGVGFGATIQRNEDNYHLFARDLKYPIIRDAKLELIKKYYENKLNSSIFLNCSSMTTAIEEFKVSCDDLVDRFEIIDNIQELIGYNYTHIIFEGAQGIMLDMTHGFFPNVTRSHTTSRNAMELIKKWGLSDSRINTYYITRAYQTRHGNGFMSNEDLDKSMICINPDETNVDTGTQGIFRRAILDVNQLQYSISCDAYHNPKSNKILVISCLDHVGESIPATISGKIVSLSPDEVGDVLGIKKVLMSNSDKGILFN